MERGQTHTHTHTWMDIGTTRPNRPSGPIRWKKVLLVIKVDVGGISNVGNIGNICKIVYSVYFDNIDKNGNVGQIGKISKIGKELLKNMSVKNGGSRLVQFPYCCICGR